MNIHPIFVHFPIALLTIYAIAELVWSKTLRAQAYWFYVKATMLFVGVLGAFIALSTGDAAESLQSRALRPLIEIHSTFAAISTWIFAILALAYLVMWFEKSGIIATWVVKKVWMQKMLALKIRVAHIILDSAIAPILALIGLIAITITGGLGGAIVYGPAVDPVVSFIYHLFF